MNTTNITTVTTFSKYFAALLFVLLPFVGVYIGYTFAPEKVVEVDMKTTVVNDQNIDSNLPSTYEEYKLAVEKNWRSAKEVLLYNYGELEPSLETIISVIRPEISSILPASGCTLIGSYNFNNYSGQIIVSNVYYGEESFVKKDTDSYLYLRSGYMSKLDLGHDAATTGYNIGPGGEQISKMTNKEWSCDQSTLLDVLETELDPFLEHDNTPRIIDFTVIS